MAEHLDALHAAIQDFSNALSDDASDTGVVRQALVLWDEISYDEDGTVSSRDFYASTGDGATPVGALGLATLGLERIKHDLGLHSRDD